MTKTTEKQEKKKKPEPLESKFKVGMTIKRLDGGIPAHPDVIRAWLGANEIQDDEELAKKIAEGTATEEELDGKLEKLTTTFRTDKDGRPCIEARCVKAFIKQIAGVTGLYGANPGLRELLKEGMVVYPELIPINVPADKLQTAVEIVQVDNRGEKVSAFKRVRFAEDAKIEFEVHALNRNGFAQKHGAAKTRKGISTLTEDLLKDLIQFGGKYVGLGANRSQGRGTFDPDAPDWNVSNGKVEKID